MVRYKFQVASAQEMETLGFAFGKVARSVLEHFAASASSANFAVIGLDAEPSTGKSTMLGGILDAMVENSAYESNRHIWPADTDGPAKPIWANIKIPAQTSGKNIQIRTYDSLVTGPFPIINDKTERFHGQEPKVPERDCPGLDFVEHTTCVPLEKIYCAIEISQQPDQSRIVIIDLPENLDQTPAVQEEFLPSVQHLAI